VTDVAVIGATGYPGVETVRLLASHPHFRLAYVGSHGQAGQRLGSVFPHLGPLGELVMGSDDPAAVARHAQLAFVSRPAGASLDYVPALCALGVKVVDFGADFRLKDPDAYRRFYKTEHTAPDWLERAVYGLAEVHRARIAAAVLVANPGCYPTAAVLALWPALAQGLLEPDDIIIDAKSGVSGKPRTPALDGMFCEADENLVPYNLAGRHRHTPEIEQELSAIAGVPVHVSFNPHVVPMTRGLLCTCYARLREPVSEAAAMDLYARWYAETPFVSVLPGGALPQTKFVLGSNACHVAVRVDGRRLIALAALDNLVKGAAGAAIQNANLAMGLPETAGLPLIGLYP
jgi:N-acetyl-gamma-glutamyl-phosphate reductase